MKNKKDLLLLFVRRLEKLQWKQYFKKKEIQLETEIDEIINKIVDTDLRFGINHLI